MEKKAYNYLIDSLLLLFLYLFFVSIPRFASYIQSDVSGTFRLAFLVLIAPLFISGYFNLQRKPLKFALLAIPCLIVCFGNIASLLYGGGSLSLGDSSIFRMVAFTFATAFAEEVIFRASFIRAFKADKRFKKVAILLSSALFGLSHIFSIFAGGSISGALIQTGYTFLLGLLLGVIHEVAGFWPCVVLHFVFNLFQTELYVSSGGGEWNTPFFVFNIVFSILGGICAVFLYFRFVFRKEK